MSTRRIPGAALLMMMLVFGSLLVGCEDSSTILNESAYTIANPGGSGSN